MKDLLNINLEDIANIKKLTNIDTIQFDKPVSVTLLKAINKLLLINEDLTIRFYGYKGLWRELSFLKHLGNIKRLKIEDWQLEDISYINQLENLKELTISGGVNKVSVKPLASLKNLTKLSVENNNFLHLGETIEILENIEQIRFYNLDINLNFLSKKEKLYSLLVQNCNVSGIQKIGNLEALEKLSLIKLKNQRSNLDFLSKNAKLEILTLREVNSLEKLPKFYNDGEKLKKVIILSNKPKLHEIKTLYTCNNLFCLLLSVNEKISYMDIEPILSLNKLKYFNLISSSQEVRNKVQNYCTINGIENRFNYNEL